MDQKDETLCSRKYQISNTEYTVIPVFRDDNASGTLEEKVKRLILEDRQCKGVKP